MPARRNAPIGAPCWVELTTSDTAVSRAFYCELLGWEAEEPNPDFGGYMNFTRNGVRVAGCMAKQMQGVPDLWAVYLQADDAEKTVEAVVANGGEVHVAPMAVGDLGTMAFVTDRGGAAVGIWQPGSHEGFGLVSEHGAPSWFELLTRDYGPTVEFYRDVFRWDTKTMGDTDEFRYTTLAQGEEMYAGIMDASAWLPAELPAHWSVYFGVDDADAALATTVELGGAIVQPAEDTEYGRLAVATDPTGAQFKLVAPNEAMPAT